MILLILFVIILLLPCVIQCLQKSITSSMNKIFLVQQLDFEKTPSVKTLVKSDILELVGHTPWEKPYA